MRIEIDRLVKACQRATLSEMPTKLTIYQAEKFSGLIACNFDFGGDVQFFYEDVRAAIENLPATYFQPTTVTPLSDEWSVDEQYTAQVVYFCCLYINDIMKWPPPWLLRAAEISVQRTRRNFPEIANADLNRSVSLWNSWHP